MELEYAIDIKMVLDIHGIKPEKLEGAIISSVVPQITYVVKEAAEKILKNETLVIGPGVKNGLNILMDIRHSSEVIWWQMQLPELQNTSTDDDFRFGNGDNSQCDR